jgi:hypothetical protein
MRPDLSAIVRSTKEEGPWEHSPGFSLRRYFYKAIGLKDRRKQLVPYNRYPQSPFHHNGFLLEFMPCTRALQAHRSCLRRICFALPSLLLLGLQCPSQQHKRCTRDESRY